MTSNHPFLSSHLLILLPLHPRLLSALPPAPLPLSLTSPTTTPPSNTTLPLPLSLTIPSPPTAGRDLECFNLTTPNAYPVDLDDCPQAIDFLYHDPTGVMTLQQFSRNARLPSTFRVPFAWQYGGCQVLLTSATDLSVDTFRLADVIGKATRLMDECPPRSKKALGGIALVGHGQSFFVALNGQDLSPDGGLDERGEGGGDWDERGEKGGSWDEVAWCLISEELLES